MCPVLTGRGRLPAHWGFLGIKDPSEERPRGDFEGIQA